MEAWKKHIGEKALEKGIINDPQWLEKLDDTMPVWAVLDLFLQLVDRLEPDYNSYD
ncbi:hypothetical protein SK3146_01017 [Paenibacillus konkukensis]|uniref:Uncharacterized protein n=1 Tax=Paenibacillus konkukensis TaxID=2020716 RepID=A0ABY4RHG1_9BACL|nr:hypothetical protein [Paenibacillus konkukensis]UQZ81861.1 hypothetical protein SK3146_01017 [Paenibacillus konkukensis]